MSSGNPRAPQPRHDGPLRARREFNCGIAAPCPPCHCEERSDAAIRHVPRTRLPAGCLAGISTAASIFWAMGKRPFAPLRVTFVLLDVLSAFTRRSYALVCRRRRYAEAGCGELLRKYLTGPNKTISTQPARSLPALAGTLRREIGVETGVTTDLFERPYVVSAWFVER